LQVHPRRDSREERVEHAPREEARCERRQQRREVNRQKENAKNDNDK
jgi:hypothetical protein